MQFGIEIPVQWLRIIGFVAALEHRLERYSDDVAARHLNRIKEQLAELQLSYEYPLGQEYGDTRTDVEAQIAGEGTENLRIIEVLRPIIRRTVAGASRIVQKGVVVVKSTEQGNG